MSKHFTERAAELAGLIGAVLGWRPDEFWQATPAEVAAVLRALAGPSEQGVSAGDLERLMAMFPDRQGGTPVAPLAPLRPDIREG